MNVKKTGKMMKCSRSFQIIVILIIGLGSFLIWTTMQAQLYQVERGQSIRDEFGFSHGTPYVMSGLEKEEVFAIYPEKSKLLHSAGFKEGDIIVSESITGFYKLLFHSRGKQVSVQVVDGGDGPQIKNRDRRTITLTVPLKK